MSDSRFCAEIIWKIENFSYCWHKCEEELNSKTMRLLSLEGSKWRLELGPSGYHSSEYVSLYLTRMDDSSTVQQIDVKFDIAILDAKNSLQMVQSFSKSFKYKSYEGASFFLKRNLLKEKKEMYLPGDVLTVVCKIWHQGAKLTKTTRCFIRTCIPVSKCAFLWRVNKAFKLNSIRIINVTLPMEGEKDVFVKLEQVFRHDTMFIKVVIKGDFKIKHTWNCDICIAGTKTHFMLYGEDIDSGSQIYQNEFGPFSFPQNFTDDDESLTSNNDDSDPENDGDLDETGKNGPEAIEIELKCLFCMVPHISQCIQETEIVHSPEIEAEPELLPNYVSKHNVKVKESYNSLHQDIIKLYSGSLLSDFTVKVQGKSFPVHSLILMSRSPVLYRMLETNMKESNIKTLELQDLDETAVVKMLDYMYSDDVGVLCFDSALKLYYAGDKYEILGLKQKASSFLQYNILCHNVSRILELADKHQDKHLMLSAVKFIFNHEREIMTSEEFRNFSKRNPELCVETMFKVSKLRFK